jgi:23S rRNA (guanosine2251-2'-O)-methyltransferase
MPPYPYVDASDLLRRRPQTPLYVVLDRIQDPYNFGAIVRSAEVLGVDGMFVAEQNQCAVTSLVARTSAGAVNYLEIARVPDFVALARQLSHTGVRLIAASQHAECRLFDCNLKGSAALVIGNEGEGIADELLQCCDVRVSIPQSGHVDSLNAAVSAGILFYEASRQRSAAQCART